MRAALRGAWLGLLLACALPVGAQVFTYIDEDGNRVFTDRPRSQTAQAVETRTTNSMPAMPVAPRSPEMVQADAEPAAGYAQLQILAPADDATIRNNAGNLEVAVDSQPPLHTGHLYRITLDGTPVGEASTSPLQSLHNIDRGSHRLQVEIVDAQGKTIQHSPPHTFHMMRASLAQRRMVKPCKKDDYGVRPECPLKDKPPEKKNIPFVPFI
ncbi:DUF4124 domain-containing protein [Stutzerimonas nitrititolerans]|uniref:DUF4124 domain-containing protein n=1 Tax=Stutzerimonas nitrititolerans TaxID=2482751 RepID=UPI0028A2718B|nr:DUF4124 domain-containing protein [Stutzerimonas nitrititolerans]